MSKSRLGPPKNPENAHPQKRRASLCPHPPTQLPMYDMCEKDKKQDTKTKTKKNQNDGGEKKYVEKERKVGLRMASGRKCNLIGCIHAKKKRLK